MRSRSEKNMTHPLVSLFQPCAPPQSPYIKTFIPFRSSHKGSKVGSKVATIASLPRPTDVTSVRAFCGVVNYYQQFIKDCGRLQSPLSELTKKGVVWRWGERQEEAFQRLKQALQGSPVLALPQRGRPFKVRCD
jgi:hypothetical protein